MDYSRHIIDSDTMRKKRKTPRRRCSICRRWYRPHPSALQTQKTCTSLDCRRHRRRRLAKRRRKSSLHEYREDERERQRVFRQRQRQAGESSSSATDRSRASLSPQLAELPEVILKIWDKASQVSRAALRRDLAVIIGVRDEKVGQVGQKAPLVTSQPL